MKKRPHRSKNPDPPGTRISRREFMSAATSIASVTILVGTGKTGGAITGQKSPLRQYEKQVTYGIIHAPSDPSQWPAWREYLKRWRISTRKSLNYDDSLYRLPEFSWVSSCYALCFLLMCDEMVYEQKKGRFTLESFLDHGSKEFGGYDGIIFWHAYPKIGFDERNQFDFYRDMPGGLEGLRRLSRICHARGVRVFLDYNPWDIGTRREAESDIDVLVELVRDVEADGLFLDTMSKGANELWARLNEARKGVAFESEGLVPLEHIRNHHLSWVQGYSDSAVPGVLRNKWIERRHMHHQISRWSRDHTAELHVAWMNGSGIVVWENVFGVRADWCPRDRTILRAMLPILRRYAGIFSGERWTPLVETEARDIYASLWEGNGLRLWTLVNRSEKRVGGHLLEVPHVEGAEYFDLIAGRRLEAAPRDGKVSLEGAIRPRGIGAFLAGPDRAVEGDFRAFLARQAELDRHADFDAAVPKFKELLKPIARTKLYGRDSIAAGMAAVPAAAFDMEVQFRVRECGFYQTPETAGMRLEFAHLHKPSFIRRKVILSPYAIDLTPVTNAQFAEFLKASGYKPKHPENFLKHWKGGTPPPGNEDHPVVYVDLDDARAYATWAGKRLPTEEEWQYAAQGPDRRLYPWGNEMKPALCNDGKSGGTTAVASFPEGRSPFGCFDMCGNVWELTESERDDGRTRFCILKGGSYFRASGSDWYADGGPQPCNFAAKMLLMWPGTDRCSTIGFRCVIDLAAD